MPPRRASLAAQRTRSYADTVCLVWFALDAFTHLVIEASYVALALGPTAATSKSPFGAIWREYGRADKRWAGRDATVISLELLTVFVGGPASAAMVYAVLKNKPWRHLVQALLSLAELYGGWMTFAPEWVEGSPSLVGREDPLRFWVHLAFMNGLWVLVPAILLAESCVQITAACAKAKTGAAPAALPAAAYHACAGSLLAYAVLVPAICGAVALGKL